MRERSRKPYPQPLRERAVRLVGEHRGAHPTEWASIVAVAAQLGIGSAETLRRWVRRSQEGPDAGADDPRIRRRRRRYLDIKLALELLEASPPVPFGRAAADT